MIRVIWANNSTPEFRHYFHYYAYMGDMGAASARVEFDIEVETNHRLNEYSIVAKGGEEDFTATITGPDGKSATLTQQHLEVFNKLMNRCEVTGEKPEDLLAQAKKISAAKKGKEAAAK